MSPARRSHRAAALTGVRGLVALVVALCAALVVGAAGASAWLRVTADEMAAEVFGKAQHPARQVRVVYTAVTDNTLPPSATEQVSDALPPELRDLLGRGRPSAAGPEGVPRTLPAGPTPGPTYLTVGGIPGLARHVDVVDGRLPRSGSREERLPQRVAASYDGPRVSPVVEVVLEQHAARAMGIGVGSYVDMVALGYRANAPEEVSLLEVVGTYRPAAAYPSPLDDVTDARKPSISTLPEFNSVRAAALAADVETVLQGGWVAEPEVRWTFDLRRLPAAEDVGALDDEARRLAVQPWPPVLKSDSTAAESGLGQLAGRFLEQRSTSDTLAAVVLAALGWAAMALLVVAAAVLGARRREVLDLLRARGASYGRLFLIRVLEGLLLVAPGILLCATLVLLGPVRAADLVPSAGVAAACVLVLAAVQVSPWRDLPERVRVSLADAVQLAVLALAAGSVVLVSVRGGGQARDPVLLLLPLLTGAAATVLLVRGVPWATRGLRRLLVGRSSVEPLVAVTQVAAVTRQVVLPLAGVVLAVVAGLLALGVTDTLERGAGFAGWEEVGADARVAGGVIPEPVVDEVAALPGVTAVAPVHTRTGLLETRIGPRRVTVVGVPGEALAQVTAAGPRPMRLPRPGAGPLPALVSADLDIPAARVSLDYAQSSVRLRLVGRPGALPGVVEGGSFVVVDKRAFEEAASRELTRPEVLLVAGRVDRQRLLATVGEEAPGARVTTRAAATARVLDDAVVTRTGVVADVVAGVAGALALFAVGLAVARTGPLRRRTTAVLEALGAGRGAVRRSTGWDLTPTLGVCLLAAAGCSALVMVVAGSAVDVAAVTGASAPQPLRLGEGSWTAAGFAALLVLAVVALAVRRDAWARREAHEEEPG